MCSGGRLFCFVRLLNPPVIGARRGSGGACPSSPQCRKLTDIVLVGLSAGAVAIIVGCGRVTAMTFRHSYLVS